MGLTPAMAQAACSGSDNDGRTAFLINPAVVPPVVDGNDCDVAILFDDGASHTVTAGRTFNARRYGILVEDGTDVDITGQEVYDIGDTPFTGAQYGTAIGYIEDSTGSVTGANLHDYQKNGTLMYGENTTVDMTNSIVRGRGPVATIAQNGIQYSAHAGGLIRGNVVTNHQYTGCSKADAKETGCTYTFATGILLYDVFQPEVDTSNNKYRKNDRNLIVVTHQSLHH
jgi:hypothetical protein